MKGLLLLFWSLTLAPFLPVQVYAEESSSSVTVITAADIERERPASVMALLREKVGIDQQGGQVSMRGVKGVVIVVDGSPYSTIPSYLNVGDVELIEIVRGAASARYGASAMGGAIVIRSKQGAAWGFELTGAYGSFDRHYEKAEATGTTGDWSFRIMGRLEESKRIYTVGPGETPFPYMIFVEPYSSRKQTLEAGMGFRGERLESELAMNYEKSSGVQGRPNATTVSTNATARWNVTYKPLNWIEIAPTAYVNYWPEYDGVRDRGTGTDASGLAPDQIMESCWLSEGLELRLTVRAEKVASFTLGGKYGRDSDRAEDKDYFTHETLFEYQVRTAHEALFLIAETTPLAGLSVDLSGRWDRFRYDDVRIDDGAERIEGNPLTKSSFNPKAGGRWQASNHLAFRASMGTGFVPPSPNNLYYENLSNPGNRALSNPGLKPEKSLTADVGLEVALARIDFSITPFYTLWQDKVEYRYTANSGVTTRRAENIGESDSRGVEIQFKGKVSDAWNAFLNYTYNETRITENDADPSVVGNEVPDMPKHKFNLGTTYEKPDDFTLKALWRYVGPRFLDQNNTHRDAQGFQWKRDPYHVVDLTAVKRFSFNGSVKGLDLTLSVENLFDVRYGKWFFYRDPGRVIMLEARLRF
jgi:outer membrane receptor protein involved in Fe transport